MLFSSTGITQFLMLLIVPILSKIYTAEQHGDMNSFLQLMAVGSALATLRYEHAIMVESDRNKARDLVKLSLWVNAAWLVLFTAILFVFQKFFFRLLDLNSFENWLYLIPITIFLIGCVETLSVWWNRERKYKKLSGNRIATSATASGYKLIHPSLKMLQINGLVLGHTLGQVISLILYLPKSAKHHLKTNWTSLKELAKQYKTFPSWAMPSTLINVIGTAMPVFIISYFFGRETNGYFANALKLTYIPMGAVGYAFGQVFYERLARYRDQRERFELSGNIIRFLYFLSLGPVIAMVVWGDIIAPFILGAEWFVTGQMIQIVVVFYFVMSLTSPFASAFEVYGKLNQQLWFTTLFTLSTGLALFLTLHYTNNVYHALMAFSFVGILVRLAMLIACFKLIGKSVIRTILFGLAILTAGITLATFIRYSLS